MLIDSHRVLTGSVVDADLCIIGSGPAGLSIAFEMMASKFRIILVESGDITDKPEIGGLADLDFSSPHFFSPQDARRHQFGGMAAAWSSVLLDGSPAARYLPLDPIDFQDRYWVPQSGWPITFEELIPYYRRAQRVCGITAFDFGAPLIDAVGYEPLSTPTGAMISRLDQLGSNTVFTDQALLAMSNSDRIQVMTNALATSIAPDRRSDAVVTNTAIRCRDGREFTVRSRFVALAGGAIDNTLVLLNSTDPNPAGFGNEFDNLGRYYMDHPRISFGYGSFAGGHLARSMALYEPHVVDRQLFIGKLKLSESVLRREEILNGNAQIFPHFLSIEQMATVQSARIAMASIRQRKDIPDAVKHFLAAGRRSFSTGRALLTARRGVSQRFDRPGSGWWTGMNARSFKVHYQPEQAPSRNNRVSLSDRLDEYGCRIAKVEWRWSDLDLQSIRKARQIFAAEISASGLGTLGDEATCSVPIGELNGPPATAHHHLGTTRMHDNKRHGVVDRNCRVHGSSSVYVAGGSVFPTAGYANPTLTIVALAIRLADELKRQLSAPS